MRSPTRQGEIALLQDSERKEKRHVQRQDTRRSTRATLHLPRLLLHASLSTTSLVTAYGGLLAGGTRHAHSRAVTVSDRIQLQGAGSRCIVPMLRGGFRYLTTNAAQAKWRVRSGRGSLITGPRRALCGRISGHALPQTRDVDKVGPPH